MSVLDIENLDTDYGRLLVGYLKAYMASGQLGDPVAAVEYCHNLVAATIRKVDEEYSIQLLVAQERERNRPKLPVEWEPEPQDTMRHGATWSADEERALSVQFENGCQLRQIAEYHRRSPTAVRSRLTGLGKLRVDGNGRFYHYRTGEHWA